MSTPVNVGDQVRLFLQMEDGEESLPLVVKAALRNESGVLLTEVILSHVGLGLFRDSSYVLTTEKEIIATFRIYEEDGVTLHPEFAHESTRFVKASDSLGGGASVTVGNEFIVEVDDLYIAETDP